MIDPFEGLEAAPNNASAQTETPATEKKETTVANTPESQSKIVSTLKGGAGFEAPWIVVHSDSAQEALDTLNDPAMKELMEQVKKAGKYFSTGAAPASAPTRGGGQPAGATQAPNNIEPPEGYVYKTGITKSGKNAGKPWYAFMGANREDNLDPIWLNADGTRRN